MASTTEARPRRGTRKPAPLYLQVVQALKDEIVKGVYPIGGQLPTEEVLCERFHVSRYTVREALRRLREDRLVTSRQGAGTVVVRPGQSGSYVHEVGSINDLIAFAVGARYQIEHTEPVRADAALAERLGCNVGDEWLAVRGFRYAAESELPVCSAEVFINAEFSGVGRLLQRHRGPIFELIEDLYGEHVAEVQQELSARPVPEDLASRLEVDAGETAIEVRRVYRLASGKTAQVVFNLHPADRFRYAITMRRVKA